MRVTRACALSIVALGCGTDREPPAAPASPGPTSRAAAGLLAPAAAAPAQVFPEGTRSLVLTRTLAVRFAPGDDTKRIGTIAVDTRVRWQRTAPGKGCDRPWVELQPRGWVCADYLTPSPRPALGREVPMLERGELVPGIYGKVTASDAIMYALVEPGAKQARRRARPVPAPPQGDASAREPRMVEARPLVGSLTVRQYGELTVAGKPYWKVSGRANEYLLTSAIRQHEPSLYAGARLGDDTGLTLPIAFVWPRAGQATVSSMTAATGGRARRRLARRTPLAVRETATDHAGTPTAYRIGDGEWVRAADVRVFQPAPPPPLLEPDERWIDVDLDNQILVAYEGALAVYATLVSTGTKQTPTETGVYRMWLKESESDMKGLSGEDPYSVATVPWTQFYSPVKGLAIHTAYWHDGFGVPKSHGCVNLAPRDARWLYFWSEPQVPPGWTMAAGVIEAPGSLVRVRSKDDPAPPLRGYAIKVDELRQARAPGTL